MNWIAVLVVVVVIAIGGGVYILIQHWKFERRQQSQRFRHSLIKALKTTPRRDFNFSKFVTESGIKWSTAVLVAEDVYATAYRNCTKEGKVSSQGKELLDRLVVALRIQAQSKMDIERDVNQQIYRSAFDSAKADGKITSSEFAELKEIREALGLSNNDVREASGASGENAYQAAFRKIVADGPITQNAFNALASIRRASGLTDVQAHMVIRDEALELYRERFAEAKQDGHIGPDEEQELRLLQLLSGLSDMDVERFRNEVRRLRYLEACRSGDLPRQQTSLLLNPRETCHWDGACTYAWHTPGGTDKRVDGRLTITSDRVIFSSMTKSFEFRFSRIIDVQTIATSVRITCTSAKGTGYYFVGDVELIEAVLYGIVRQRSPGRSENLSSSRSRHIPSEVQRRVWRRDGGRCVQCGMREDIHFDHIIPFSKGGANTIENIQLLCQQCNLRKSDKIGG